MERTEHKLTPKFPRADNWGASSFFLSFRPIHGHQYDSTTEHGWRKLTHQRGFRVNMQIHLCYILEYDNKLVESSDEAWVLPCPTPLSLNQWSVNWCRDWSSSSHQWYQPLHDNNNAKQLKQIKLVRWGEERWRSGESAQSSHAMWSRFHSGLVPYVGFSGNSYFSPSTKTKSLNNNNNKKIYLNCNIN